MMSSIDKFDAEPMSTDMLEDIRDHSQSHPSINRRNSRYKIRDHIKRGQSEWKRTLLSTQNMVKVSLEVFKDVANDISQSLPIFG